MSALETLVRDLHRRRGRERRGLALAEGVRLVEEALAAGVQLQGALVAPSLEGTPRGAALKGALVAAGVPLETVSDQELVKLADTEHPQGVLAVVRPPEWSLEEVALDPAAAVLVLDAVQDPGNVGTMLRTALALGARGVVALPGTADLYNSKVIRGSMGALFRFPCVSASIVETLAWAQRVNARVLLAESGGPGLSRGLPRGRATLIVVGNEGAGISPTLIAATGATAERIGIPLAEGAESLNVAVAAGILLHEVMRGN
jgi:TrmH family RNA methyltransferase